MWSPFVRVVLPALVLITGAGAAAWSWHLAQRVDALHRAGDQTLTRVDRLQEWLDAVADQELLFTSSGRVDRQTMESVSSLLRQIAIDCASLAAESLAAATPAVRAVDDAGRAVGEVNARAEENLRAGLDLTAADLAFTETHQLRRALRREIRAVRAAEAAALAEARSAGRTQAWFGLGGVALLLAGVLLIGARTSSAMPRPADPAESAIQAAAGATTESSVRAPASDDLAGIADLCARLGQLKTESELRAVLDEAGVLLGASGLIVWMGAGEELFSATAVGYESSHLSRLGPIPRDAPNATATAWRTGTIQTVRADGRARAGLVAPLHGPAGCIGALALELSPDTEDDRAIQSRVRLIAALLGAVLAPGPAASAPAAEVLPFERSAHA